MKVVLTSFVKQLMAVGICCAVGELNLSSASATPAAVSGPSALALAAVVASHGSQLGSFDKRAMLRLFDGKSVVITRVNKITVAADSITCFACALASSIAWALRQSASTAAFTSSRVAGL